jgi:tripartite-type tricarboxylate transporter receptor subunit TctC
VMAPMLGQITSGDIKALVTTSAERHPNLPDVPTVAEAGFADYDVATWYGLVYPAGVPTELVEAANAAVLEVLENDTLAARALDQGFVINGSTPEDFTAHFGSEVERWSEVRENAGIDQL